MRIPLDWLRELVPVTDGAAAAGALTRAGLEAALERGAEPPALVVTARVLECAKHANADKLSVCRVDEGRGEPVVVVCGAPNVAAGQTVALARPGTDLGDFVVGVRKVRGVESAGMLCSERELGLSDDHDGILVLPPDTPLGRPLREVLPRREILVTEPTSNRGDCMSVLGTAREAAAVLDVPLAPPKAAARAADAGPWRVEIADPADCARYCARIVEGVIPGPSPAWLQERLLACGVRPILNLVDVTNYVLLELGHPMHAFDLGKLRGTTIGVRRASAGESLVTLDGKERALTPDVLVITDASGPVALGGLMGGDPTAVSDGTRDILLEGASFSPARVRSGARSLGMATDASARFERGVDPEGLPAALDRAVELLVTLCPTARLVHAANAYPRPPAPRRVPLRARTLSRILGVEVPREEVERILARLGLAVEADVAGWTTVPPSWRPDLTAEEDLVEEVGRVFGYDRIPDTVRVHAAGAAIAAPEIAAVERARQLLLGLGLAEVVTPGLVDAGREGAFADATGFFAPPVPVRNPLSGDRDALRGTLLPSLVQVLATNRARSTADLAIFEVSRTYARLPSGGVSERPRAAILLSGRGLSAGHGLEDKSCDLFDMKGLVEVYVEEFWGVPLEAGDEAGSLLHPGLLRPDAGSPVRVGGRCVGFFGEAGKDVRRAWDLPGELPVFLAELDLSAQERSAGPRVYRPLPRHPGASRDLAFVAPAGVRHADLAGTIVATGGDLLEECRLFDVYEGAPLAKGERSLAFTLVFRAPDRSLTNDEVDAQVARIVETVRTRHGARIR